MKYRLCQFLSLGLLLAAQLPAQEPAPPAPLDQLLGPIALYPDALIALILPAATAPSDVALAARYLQDGGDPSHTDDQPWDDSLKALTHYPDVVNWMNQNMAWTEEVGEAFNDQPADVMNSIQHLRTEARAAGTLVDTPQQQVIVEGDELSIVPVQPDVIYVPYYDPEVVYVSRPGYYSDSYLTFGTGYATGFWLAYDFDWRQRRIWTIDSRYRQRYWHDRRDSRQPGFTLQLNFGNDPNRRQWQPRPGAPRPARPAVTVNRPRAEIPRPAPFPNAPPRSPAARRNPSDRSPDNRNQPPTPGRRPENSPVPPPARVVVPPQQPSPPPAARRNPSDRSPDNRNQLPVPNQRPENSPTQPPARAAAPLPQPAPQNRQIIPTPQARPPTQPPAQDDKNNKDNRRGRAPDDKPAVTPPPQPAGPPVQLRPAPPAARQPTQSPAQDDKGKKDETRGREPDDKPAVSPQQRPSPPQPPAAQTRQVVRPAPPAARQPAPPPSKDDNGKDDNDNKDDRRGRGPDDNRQKN